jgi:hypothetical protein
MNWLKGKKTYIIAALMVAQGLVEFITTGDFSWTSIIAFIESEQIALLAATIRNGIGNNG